MATYDNGLAATCYGPCKVTALVADRVPVVIACKTDYPFNETIEISVQPAREAAFPLDFHIPGWCAAPTLSVNGSAVAVERNARGFRARQPDLEAGRHRPAAPADDRHACRRDAMPRRARPTTARIEPRR